MSSPITVAGVTLDVERSRPGTPAAVPAPRRGTAANTAPGSQALARDHRVIAPHHPGFGNSALPDWFGTVDDIAYLYLDLAQQLGLQDAVLVGACFGGWIAAEMAVRDTAASPAWCWSAPLGN